MIPRLDIVTIVLDGIPFLPMQLANFNRIDTSLIDWRWHIIEGAAANRGSTAWCQPQQPRLSRDGSTELLRTWLGHPRIFITQKTLWERGKDEMVNHALSCITEPGLLLQVDVDEIWSPDQLETLVGFFNAYDKIKCARFFCRYFVGPNIITTSENAYGNNPGEWLRAFRFEPGMRFLSHEPPRILGCMEPYATREQTREVGLVFDHWSYVFEKQVAYKGQFYKYPNAVAHWRRLQENKTWPVKLKSFLPWTDDAATADRLFK